MTDLEYGLCECGCGKKTRLAPQSCTTKGWLRGQPLRFLSHHYPQYTMSLADRLWSGVDKTCSPHGCWLWVAKSHIEGYGTFKYRGKTVRVHRIAWQIEHGPVPSDMMVLHSCESFYARGDITYRRCVRHLYLGNKFDNARDMVSSGRWQHGHVSGEQHYNAKLTYQQVLEIREKYAAGGMTQRVLGDEYGVHSVTIWAIVHGTAWASVPVCKDGEP